MPDCVNSDCEESFQHEKPSQIIQPTSNPTIKGAFIKKLGPLCSISHVADFLDQFAINKKNYLKKKYG